MCRRRTRVDMNNLGRGFKQYNETPTVWYLCRFAFASEPYRSSSFVAIVVASLKNLIIYHGPVLITRIVGLRSTESFGTGIVRPLIAYWLTGSRVRVRSFYREDRAIV